MMSNWPQRVNFGRQKLRHDHVDDHHDDGLRQNSLTKPSFAACIGREEASEIGVSVAHDDDDADHDTD